MQLRGDLRPDSLHLPNNKSILSSFQLIASVDFTAEARKHPHPASAIVACLLLAFTIQLKGGIFCIAKAD